MLSSAVYVTVWIGTATRWVKSRWKTTLMQKQDLELLKGCDGDNDTTYTWVWTFNNVNLHLHCIFYALVKKLL